MIGGLALALVVSGLFAASALAASCPKTSLPALENEVMCVICGVPLVNAGGQQAENERRFIREGVAKCQTKQQIKNGLVDEYGKEVLAMPATHGFGLWAYLVPIIAFILAAIAVTLGALRWRRNRTVTTEPTPDSAGSAAGAALLDKDLDRYDL